MKVAVVGAGALGGYAAARWHAAGCDVTLFARGSGLAHIEARGLSVSSPLGDVHAAVPVTGDPSALAQADVVVFATMSWQLAAAVEEVAPHLRADAAFLGVQNGVGSVAVLSRFLPAQNVLGGTCRIICYVESPGVIRHVGVEPAIVFGEVGGGLSSRTTEIERSLDLGPVLRMVPSPDVSVEIWKKYLMYAPVSTVGSVTGRTIGEFRADPENRSLLEAGVGEIVAVAEALGVDLGEEPAEWALAFIDGLPANGTSSMHRDFEAGRRTELNIIADGVVRHGRELGVPTPMFDFVLGELMPLELVARGSQ